MWKVAFDILTLEKPGDAPPGIFEFELNPCAVEEGNRELLPNVFGP